jgi:hypothetical protein
MKPYADLPARRLAQVAGDVLLVVWILAWAWLGHAVHDATMNLAEPGHRVESSAAAMADRLHGAGSAVGDLPVVGEQASTPLDEAGAAADGLAEAGRQQVSAVEGLARWLGWSVALIPVLVAVVAYVPGRVRFARRAAAGQALVDSAADLDLFALRALAHQPLHRLATISPDPARAWRERDADVVRRLAALELAESGLSADAVPARAVT